MKDVLWQFNAHDECRALPDYKVTEGVGESKGGTVNCGELGGTINANTEDQWQSFGERCRICLFVGWGCGWRALDTGYFEGGRRANGDKTTCVVEGVARTRLQRADLEAGHPVSTRLRQRPSHQRHSYVGMAPIKHMSRDNGKVVQPMMA